MIPKTIHYCWFGGNPLPELARKCIASWKKYLPEYEIKEWNESNFNVNSIPYTAEAYKAKKYAFVSDYARFWILYHHGGLYFDTDVEIIRPLDDIVARGPFMGCENVAKEGFAPSELGVAPGLGLGVNPGLGLYRELQDLYQSMSFYKPDGSYNQTTIVYITTNLLVKHGLKNTPEIQFVAGVWIYPKDYFCPIDYRTKEMVLTAHTYTIHHYMASWITKGQKLYVLFKKLFGEKAARKASTILKQYKLVK